MADNTDKIIKILESMDKRLDGLQGDVSGLKQGQSHIATALKTVATKRDVEDLADGQDELRAILHTREAKLVKKVKEHEDRIAELERHAGITNKN